jgi:serine/threonine protein kinase
MTTVDAIALIEGAKSADSLFGTETDKRFKELVGLVHPDKADVKLKARAEKAFNRLVELRNGKNGKPLPGESIIGNWIVGAPVARGDICDVYCCEQKDDHAVKGIFKIARSPRDTDLMEQERFILKYLADKKPANFSKYLPTVFDSLDASGRRANVLSPADGLSLAEIGSLFGSSLDPKHAIWMLNRSLSILGFIHKHGVVHGGVLPTHLIFGPKTHGLMLVDWCYSVTAESEKHIPAVVKDYSGLYPLEVSRKKPGTPETDIYMLFAAMRSTLVQLPKRFHGLFDWCMAASPKARPSEAWEVQERLVALAKEEYGEPRYIELVIPVS